MITPTELLAGNELHASRFTDGDLMAPPRRRLAIGGLHGRPSPLLPPDLEVHGYRYDVRTGKVQPAP